MTELHTHTLDGCTPTPLAGYLKALGVLRLLASAANNISGEAADASARGWWKNERFHLKTKLGRDALLKFFIEDYAPSPVIGPWNGRAGFLEGDAGEESNRTGATLMRAIEISAAKRFQGMKDVILLLRAEPELVTYDRARASLKTAKGDERRQLQKLVEQTKSILLPSIRANAAPQHLAFIDACFVLAEEEQASPLLGSGGNDGSRDFGVNFAEALEALFDFNSGSARPAAAIELKSSLFGSPGQLERTGSIGQYGPGQGGPNASTGFDGENALNRWDVLLLLEGTLIFAGALTRRWGAVNSGRASFPFTFEANRAGSGALSTEDSNAPRGEIWTPLWEKPARFSEIETLLSEGRLTLGRSSARSGLDAARAVSTLGLSRGIASFERYSLIQPDAKMPYQATPLGRYSAPKEPRRDSVADLDRNGWLFSLRRASGKNAPARARTAIRQLDDALFDLTQANKPHETQQLTSRGIATQKALIALGSVASWLATSKEARESVSPPPRLGSQWIRDADDQTAEFRIAAALASLGLTATAPRKDGSDDTDDNEREDPEAAADGKTTGETAANSEASSLSRGAPPMAAHLVSLDEKTFGRKVYRWAEATSRTAVWGAGPLVQNMIAVLERRLVEQAKRGLDDKPLAGAMPARLSDIAAFLQGPPFFNDARCAALLAGLVWAQPAWLSTKENDDAAAIPFAYAVLKPLFMPDRILRTSSRYRQSLADSAKMPIPPGLIVRLRRNDVSNTVTDALHRARASGLALTFSSQAVAGGSLDSIRLAAGLLIPVDDYALTQLMKRAYPKIQDEGEQTTNTENN